MEDKSSNKLSNKSKITVLGSANYDIFIFVERPPEMGETISANKLTNACGGKGANQAVTVGKLGYNVDFVGQFGGDPAGGILKQEMQSYNVNLDKTKTLNNISSGQAFIFSYPNKDNSIVIVGGANMDWSKNDLAALKESLSNCKCILIIF